MDAYIQVLFNDKHFLVCRKPPHIISESPGLPDILCRQEKIPNLYPVHRLDRETGGTVLLARDASACAVLQQLFLSGQILKEYLAVAPAANNHIYGTYQDLLFHDQRQNKTFVVKKMRKGVKKAECSWNILTTQTVQDCSLSLYRVLLHSGRSHQIRVQFASRGFPLYGDRRYGSAFSCGLALWSYHISFFDPFNPRQFVSCTSLPPDDIPWSFFSETLSTLGSTALENKQPQSVVPLSQPG